MSVTAYRNFGRVTVVYSADAASSSAYSALNRTVIGDWTLYVIPEEPTCVDMHTSATHLEVPPSTGAFVMSPPPSPPAGWAPDEESPPVQGLNLSMLALALDDLGSRLDGSGRLTLFEHEHPDVPRIVVEDFDADQLDSSAHPVVRPPFRPTERPPLPASMI